MTLEGVGEEVALFVEIRDRVDRNRGLLRFIRIDSLDHRVPQDLRVLVVNRNPDLELRPRPLPDTEDVWKDHRMSNPPRLVLLGRAFDDTSLDDAELELVETDLQVVLDGVDERLFPPQGEHIVAKEPMEILKVHRIEGVLHDLQPVARQEGTTDRPNYVRLHEQVERRKHRSRIGAEVGPYQPTHFPDLVRRGDDAILEPAVSRFWWLLKARPVLVEEPPVVRTSQRVGLGNAEEQRAPAVRAPLGDEAELPRLVLEQHEILAEQSNLLRAGARQFRRAGDGHPVPSQQVAGRCPRPHPRHPVVDFGADHPPLPPRRFRSATTPTRHRSLMSQPRPLADPVRVRHLGARGPDRTRGVSLCR